MVDTNEQSREAQNTTERWPRVVIVGGGFAGLRVSEAVCLKVTDIDRQRMVIRVEQGKKVPKIAMSCSPQSCSKPCATGGEWTNPMGGSSRAI